MRSSRDFKGEDKVLLVFLWLSFIEGGSMNIYSMSPIAGFIQVIIEKINVFIYNDIVYSAFGGRRRENARLFPGMRLII